MPTPTKGARLGGGPAHERHMLANLAQSLFEHGRITTTEARAKRLRPYAERLVTFAKRGDLASRRRASLECPTATRSNCRHRATGLSIKSSTRDARSSSSRSESASAPRFIAMRHAV